MPVRKGRQKGLVSNFAHLCAVFRWCHGNEGVKKKKKKGKKKKKKKGCGRNSTKLASRKVFNWCRFIKSLTSHLHLPPRLIKTRQQCSTGAGL